MAEEATVLLRCKLGDEGAGRRPHHIDDVVFDLDEDVSENGDEIGTPKSPQTPCVANMVSGCLLSGFSINMRSLTEENDGVTGVGIRSSEAVALHRQFAKLDINKDGKVSMLELWEVFSTTLPITIEDMTSTICALNTVLGPSHKFGLDEISLETFEVLMLASDVELRKNLGDEHAASILKLRHALVCDTLVERVSSLFKLGSKLHAVTAVFEKFNTLRRKERFNALVEPFIAFIILLNGLAIGISLDLEPEWLGWDIGMIVFLAFFILELLVRLKLTGFVAHFFGEDWMQNWFDFTCIVFGTIDVVVMLIGRLTHYYTFTVLRMCRLVRVFRLARLAHLQCFKELSLLLNGLFGGLRTLFWSIMILIFLLFFFGILLRQAMEREDGYDCEEAISAGLMLEGGRFRPEANCNRGEREFDMYGDILFSTVSRSMVTVFQCFTDSCSAPDGTPMVWYWWDTHGIWMVIAFGLAYILVTFGVFNLIFAIFVENTLNYAHLAQQTRMLSGRKAAIYKAQQLQRLLISMFRTEEAGPIISESSKIVGSWWNGVFSRYSRRQKDIRELLFSDSESDCNLTLRLNEADFEQALQRDDVQKLLADLDVSPSSCDRLFSILDSDGNGYVSISELADGVMKLRGPTDKGDIVSVTLMVRYLQQHLARFEDAVMNRQEVILDLLREKLGSDRSPASRRNKTE